MGSSSVHSSEISSSSNGYSSSSSWSWSWFRRTKKQDTLKAQEANKQALMEFGITDQLIEFIKVFTVDTFKSFPVNDDGGVGESGTVASFGNVRQDLTDWQEKHATLLISNIKEISQLRYLLCPRHMKDWQFWHIYFKLVNSYVTQYEVHAARQAKLKSMECESEISKSKAVYEVEMMESSTTIDNTCSNGNDNS